MTASYRVLVAEDEPIFGKTVARFLQDRGHKVKVCDTGEAAVKAIDEAEWDVLLLDLKLPDASGVDVLAEVRGRHPDLQTIILTGHADIESAISTMRLGAFDYLTKPPNFDELGVRVAKAGDKTALERENRRLRFQMQRVLGPEIVTRSAAFEAVLRTIDKVAPARTPILIEGETGVGKELVAQRLHRSSPRSGGAFVDLNCAAVPANLLESELFGHEKGAFTGAQSDKLGLIEVADGGTLFLDEVGEMAREIQSKFLRVLDSGTFYRVGATQKRSADFRLVAATNCNLAEEVESKRFRKDLFYRMNGVRVQIPPLRERPEDVAPLVQRFASQLGGSKSFSESALAALVSHDWPGNVRELQFAVERAWLLTDGDEIEASDLPPEIAAQAGGADVPAELTRLPSPAGAHGLDEARIRAALEQARWRRAEAAQLLGVSPRTLYRWLKKLGL